MCLVAPCPFLSIRSYSQHFFTRSNLHVMILFPLFYYIALSSLMPFILSSTATPLSSLPLQLPFTLLFLTPKNCSFPPSLYFLTNTNAFIPLSSTLLFQVLADQGVCLIDEFDKMNEQVRTHLLPCTYCHVHL